MGGATKSIATGAGTPSRTRLRKRAPGAAPARLGALLLVISLCPTSAAGAPLQPEAKTRILIDADPGIDDATAILLALASPRLDVVGITTVFGNATLAQSTANALQLLEVAERPDVAVARGASRPLKREADPPPDFVHGKDGLGEVDRRPTSLEPVASDAANFIVETVSRSPGEITLVAIGRLTNLARAVELEPRLARLVKAVVIMGGAARVAGNVTPVAEANIWGDPDAADIALGAGWPITMVPLDVTTRVRLTDDRLERIARRSPRIGRFVFDISRFYRDFYISAGVTGGFYVHDPSAVACVIDPSLFETESAPVRVVTEGPARGQTIAAFGRFSDSWEETRGRPPVQICTRVDAGRLLGLLEETLSR